jgi:hypothetical protein
VPPPGSIRVSERELRGQVRKPLFPKRSKVRVFPPLTGKSLYDAQDPKDEISNVKDENQQMIPPISGKIAQSPAPTLEGSPVSFEAEGPDIELYRDKRIFGAIVKSVVRMSRFRAQESLFLPIPDTREISPGQNRISR